tara:strand:- start:364 stop:552 length:189 start_codon:yes stop_codon:yes gene_type:complete
MNESDIVYAIVFAIFSVALLILCVYGNSKRNRKLRIFFGTMSAMFAICSFASLSMIFGNPSE